MTGQRIVLGVKGAASFSAMVRCSVLLVLLILTSAFMPLAAEASIPSNVYEAAPLFNMTVANGSRTKPVSIPVKALVERVIALKSGKTRDPRFFRYDIDSLGYGVAVRMRVAF